MPEPKHQGLSMLPMSKVLISLLDWLLCLFQEWRQETQTIQPPNKYVTQLERKKVKVLVTQSCLTLCDTMDCSPPGSFHGILQARILEWIAMPFSRGSSQLKEPESPSLQADSLPPKPPGKPCITSRKSHLKAQFWLPLVFPQIARSSLGAGVIIGIQNKKLQIF